MPDQTRILFFQPSSVFGGAERTAVNLVNAIDRARFAIVLVGNPDVFAAARPERFYSTREHGISEGFGGLRRLWRDARTLNALARREDCRVVLGFLHYGAIVAAACRVLSLGRVRGIASPRTPSRLGIAFHVGERGWAARLWHGMIHFASRFANGIVVASAGLREECIADYGARPESVFVVPNSVDLARIGTVPDGAGHPPSRVPTLVSFGRLAPEKDFPTLLKAVALARRHGPLRLRLIGGGEMDATLRALLDELGIADCVEFAPFTPTPFAEVMAADVFVHTALFEGFGNTILEAMACGTPVIATDCDFGPREIIRDGLNGLLAPVANPRALAGALSRLLQDAPLRRRLAAAGRATAAAHPVERMARGYEAAVLATLAR